MRTNRVEDGVFYSWSRDPTHCLQNSEVERKDGRQSPKGSGVSVHDEDPGECVWEWGFSDLFGSHQCY